MINYGAVSLAAPLTAIVVALLTKRVITALFLGTLVGLLVMNHGNILDSVNGFVAISRDLLSKVWILQTFGFLLLMGSVMTLMEKSGGVDAFVHVLTQKMALVKSPRASLLLIYFIGIVIFIETSITVLVAGSVGRPLCDAHQISRAKLAYVCDSTSAPVGSVIMLNGYGALMLGLITVQMQLGYIEGDNVAWLISAISYNFYAFFTLILTFLVIWFSLDIGAMKRALVKHEHSLNATGTNPWYMITPIAMMVGGVFLFLFISGKGNILKGDASGAIFYTMVITFITMGAYFIFKRVMRLKEVLENGYLGAKGIFKVTSILFFAFGIGAITNDMHTGLYLASFTDSILSPIWLASIIFLLAAIISFSTGTSWGTFSVMIPIAIPLAVSMDANIALVMGAVISGGIFGDHCSPISDTTIISSMASGCDHVEHVKTQLPYALISGVSAFFTFAFISGLT